MSDHWAGRSRYTSPKNFHTDIKQEKRVWASDLEGYQPEPYAPEPYAPSRLSNLSSQYNGDLRPPGYITHHIPCDYSDEVSTSILSDPPVEETLHVIMVISNPCGYRRRIQLAKDFIKRMEATAHVQLYIVELAYPTNPKYEVTDPKSSRHCRLLTETPLWHKESMINVGVRTLLPDNWKAMAWIDADLSFDDPHWALNTLKVLNRYDCVQLFTSCMDLDPTLNYMRVYQGGAYQYLHNHVRDFSDNYWHSGYAWAMTREAFDKLGGLFEYSILGSGDDNMMRSFIGEKAYYTSVRGDCTFGYKAVVREFSNKCLYFTKKPTTDCLPPRYQRIRIGYIPGNIKHYYHGSKANRKYVQRWEYIIRNSYDPDIHVTHDDHGLIVPTNLFPAALKTDILNYFYSRNEDEAWQ